MENLQLTQLTLPDHLACDDITISSNETHKGELIVLVDDETEKKSFHYS